MLGPTYAIAVKLVNCLGRFALKWGIFRIMKDGPINPMVRYLNSLRTQQEGANPTYVYETRGEFLEQLRREYADFPSDPELHAPTTLDELATAISDSSVG